MYISKKIIVSIAAAGLILGSGFSTAWAVESATNQTGTITIADGTGGGSGFTIDLSPGGVMSYNSTQNEFAVSSASNSANADYRLEYGVYSPVTGYYQLRNDNTNGNTEWDGSLTVGTDPFTSWTYMGNS